MRTDDFDYPLPPAQIAQRPPAQRDASRMLLLDRLSGQFHDGFFHDLPSLLRGNELIVLNNARVLPARLFGRRAGVHSQPASTSEHLSGTVEVFLTRRLQTNLWEALVRPGKKLPIGEKVYFGKRELEGEIVTRGERGLRTIAFYAKNGKTVEENLELLGHMPLPPYIDRPDDLNDRERYQTVFAAQPGAVAAPTAGLHFTSEIFDRIRVRGCEICELTLDVGLGTFQPVHTATLEDHKIHVESYEISGEAAQLISRAKRAGKPILAIGTTVVRALEDSAQRCAAATVKNSSEEGIVRAGREDANIFILPGHSFRVVDQLLTNFHLPKSTLLALVSAFAGREHVLAAYRHAVAANYRFFSYGDCMLIR